MIVTSERMFIKHFEMYIDLAAHGHDVHIIKDNGMELKLCLNNEEK